MRLNLRNSMIDNWQKAELFSLLLLLIKTEANNEKLTNQKPLIINPYVIYFENGGHKVWIDCSTKIAANCTINYDEKILIEWNIC